MKMIALVSLILAASSCGKAEDDEVDEAEESSSTVTGVGGAAGTEGVGTLTIGSGLASIPDPASVFKASLASLSLAAVGQPPLFATLGEDVAGNLSGDVTELIAAIVSAQAAHDWTGVRALTEDFRNAQAKCRVMEDTARQVQDLADMTNSTCKMKKVGAKGADALRAVTGTLPADGDFFVNTGDADVRRVIKVGAPDLDKIAFTISGKTAVPSGYRIKMTFCTAAGKAKGAELVAVDGALGTVTHETVHHDERVEVRQGVNVNAEFRRHALIKGVLKTEALGLAFDGAKARSVAIENLAAFASDVQSSGNSFNAQIEIAGGELVTKFVGVDSFVGPDGVKQGGKRRGIASTAFTGTSAATVAIAEGAGKQIGEFYRGEQPAIPATKIVAFSYDETKTPKYTTVTSGKYFDTVTAMDFALDPLLKLEAPAEPVLTLAADADCDTTTAEVVARMNGSPALQASMAECDSVKDRFKGGDTLCQALGQQERYVFEALRADKVANPGTAPQ